MYSQSFISAYSSDTVIYYNQDNQFELQTISMVADIYYDDEFGAKNVQYIRYQSNKYFEPIEI